MKKNGSNYDDDLLPEYDPELIHGGARGKYAARYGASMPFASIVAEAFRGTESGESSDLDHCKQDIDEERIELGASDQFWNLIRQRRAEPTISREDLECRLAEPK